MRTETNEQLVSLDASAVATLKQWIGRDPRPGLAFRVTVESGGCSGLRYEVILDDARAVDDVVSCCHGVEVICDPYSARYVRGATIHYSQTGFSVRNPNARGACMCGASFSARIA